MTHRISLLAFDPARVAAVLAELTAGRAEPYASILPGSHLVRAGTRQPVAIEVYPDDPAAERKSPAAERRNTFDPAAADAHRFPLSVPLDRAAIQSIAAREGWRTTLSGRGMLGLKAAFQVVELWIENRILAELTPRGIAEAVAQDGSESATTVRAVA